MLYLGMILAMACAGASAFMLTFVRVFRPDGAVYCVAEEWEREKSLPVKGYRCCNALRLSGTRRRYRALFRDIANDLRERGEISEIRALMMREGGVVFEAMRYCNRNSRAFSGLETFQNVPLVVWRKLFALSGYEISVSPDRHDEKLYCRYETVYEAAALILFAVQPVRGALQAEWWSFCCRRLKSLLSKVGMIAPEPFPSYSGGNVGSDSVVSPYSGMRFFSDSIVSESVPSQAERGGSVDSEDAVSIPPYSGEFLAERFAAIERAVFSETGRILRPTVPILAEAIRYTLDLRSADGRQCGALTHYDFGVLETDCLELALLPNRLCLSVFEECVRVHWRVKILRQTEYELTVECDGRELTISLLSVGALAIRCRGRIPASVRRALTELSSALRRRKFFCRLKMRRDRAWLLVCHRRQFLSNLGRLFELTDGFRIAACLAGDTVPRRFGGLLEAVRLPSEFRMEQFLYALQGNLPQIHAGNLFETANYLMISCDSRCTDRLLNEIAALYVRLKHYEPNTCLLVTGKSIEEAREKFGFLRYGPWSKGMIYTSSRNPNRRVLEKNALLCAKNGKLESVKRVRGDFMRQNAMKDRKIESSLDELLGIDRLFALFYAEPCRNDACREVISDVLDGFMKLQIPYKLHLRNRFVEWFSLQSTDGRICSRYSTASLTEGNAYTTLLPIVLVMFYVQIFHDDAILQTQLAYRADAEEFGGGISESLFEVRRPVTETVARRQISSISDTLLFHIVNGLGYCIESRYRGTEDGLYRYFLNACLRFFGKKISNMSVRVRLLAGVRYCVPPSSGTLCDFILHEVFLKKNMLEAMENFDRALTRLQELKGTRRKTAIVLLMQFYYRRVLQIGYRGQTVSVKPRLWLRESYDVRIDRFSCKVTRGKNGVILDNIFYGNINYVSLDTKKSVTILTDGDGTEN